MFERYGERVDRISIGRFEDDGLQGTEFLESGTESGTAYTQGVSAVRRQGGVIRRAPYKAFDDVTDVKNEDFVYVY